MIKINFGTSLCKIDAKSSEINLNLERSSIIASPSSNISAWAEVPTFIERNFQTYSNIQHVLQAFETVFTTYRWFSLDFMKQIGDCSKFSDNFQEKIRKFKPIFGEKHQNSEKLEQKRLDSLSNSNNYLPWGWKKPQNFSRTQFIAVFCVFPMKLTHSRCIFRKFPLWETLTTWNRLKVVFWVKIQFWMFHAPRSWWIFYEISPKLWYGVFGINIFRL